MAGLAEDILKVEQHIVAGDPEWGSHHCANFSAGAERTSQKRNLIVVRCGKSSLHRDWLKGGARNWDLMLCPYEPIDKEDFRTTYVPGQKWHGMHHFFSVTQEWLQYDYICVPDDDLAADAQTWSKFFDICSELNAKLAAPALTPNYHFSHLITMQNTSFRARRTTFVECGLTCMRRDFLIEALPTMRLTKLGVGVGIDLIWPFLLEYQDIWIVDETPVHHTRPVGSNYSDMYRALYNYDFLFVSQMGIPWEVRTLGGYVGPTSYISSDELDFAEKLRSGFSYLLADYPHRAAEIGALRGGRQSSTDIVVQGRLAAAMSHVKLGDGTISRGKPAMISSISPWSWCQDRSLEASGANDGLINGFCGFHTAEETDPWWDVDLLHDHCLSQVAVYNRLDQRRRCLHFDIQISPDRQNWRTIFSKRDDHEFGGIDGDPLRIDFHSCFIGRFVRLQAKGKTCLHLDQIEIFGVQIKSSESAHAELLTPQLTDGSAEKYPSNSKTRAIVCFVEDNGYLVQQVLALHQSLLYSECDDTDLVVMGPADVLAGLPADIVKIEQRIVAGDPEWCSYDCANSIACMNGPGAHQLDRYSHILRADADTFVTPAWNHFRPDGFVCGNGSYCGNDEPIRGNLRRIAAEFGLEHHGLFDVGSTWYGPTALVRRTSALAEMLLRHILLNEFQDGEGVWPSWYRGVALLYAGEIAVNHLAPDAVKTDQLDWLSHSRDSIHRHAHIHCWHTDEKFSKHCFMAGRYTQADAENLDLEIIADYAMEMSFRSIRNPVQKDESRLAECPVLRPDLIPGPEQNTVVTNNAPVASRPGPQPLIRTLARFCRPASLRSASPGTVADQPLEALLVAATDHGVLGLLTDALQSGLSGSLGDDVNEALAIYRQRLDIDSRGVQAQLAELLRLFASHKLPVIPFKGPILALAYTDPALRPCRDLDLMVRSADVSAVVTCLEDAGFTHERNLDAHGLEALRRYAGEYIMFRTGALPVEPHWLPAPRTMAFDIDIEALWRRALPSTVLGEACLLPSPEDHLFLLALHGAKEQWHQLKWVADLPALLVANPDLDLDALRARAAASGCRRVVDLALLLSHCLFDLPAATPPADPATHRLARDVLARLDRTTAPPPGPYVLTSFHWHLRERLRDRMRYAVRTLFTPRVAHYARLPLPKGLQWLHVLLKLPWDYGLTPMVAAVRRRRRATTGPTAPTAPKTPTIDCLMGTYGRHELVCEALACFLQQSVTSGATMLIYNQHPVPLVFDHPRVRIVNEAAPAVSLRHIRQRMHELARPDADLIHWWDDDDLYLPWHLQDCLDHIGDNVAWKPGKVWFSRANETFSRESYTCEGSWVFRADHLKTAPIDTHPGYTDHPVIQQTAEAELMATTDLGDLTSYIYRDTGNQHLSAFGTGSDAQQAEHVGLWRSRSVDVRSDGRLKPADLSLRWRQYLDGIKDQVAPENWALAQANIMHSLSAGQSNQS